MVAGHDGGVVERASLTGVVLAGGRGRRFGRPKAGVEVGGVPLVQRAVDLLAPRVARVVVSSRAGVAMPAVVGAGVVLDDERLGDGPMAAVASALAVVATPAVVVLACDLPAAEAAIEAVLAAGPPAMGVDEDGRVQPLCGCYWTDDLRAAADAALAAGRPRMVDLAEALGAQPVAVPPGALRNVNTPDDLPR